MLSVKGYVSGNSIVADDFLPDSFDGKEVIITVLDSFRKPSGQHAMKKRYTESDVEEAFGLWKNHEDSENVEEYVRTLRRGRHFDI